MIPNARDCVRGIALARKKDEGCVVTNRFFVVRHKKDVVHLKYLYNLLRQPEIHCLLKRQATGEINPSVPVKKLQLIKVPLPETEKEQLQITNFIENKEDEIRRLKKEVENCNSLIAEKIRGDIPGLKEPSERAKKLGSEFIYFI